MKVASFRRRLLYFYQLRSVSCAVYFLKVSYSFSLATVTQATVM